MDARTRSQNAMKLTGQKNQSYLMLSNPFPIVKSLQKKRKMFTQNGQIHPDLFQKQNQINKIKNYSRILENSSKMSEIGSKKHNTNTQYLQIQTPSNQAKQKNNQIQQNVDNQQIEKVYNYYASKNQRKNKILTKAKQLGRNNFYKFLKGSSIIENNKHARRFYQKQSLDTNEQETTPVLPTQMSSSIVSYQPFSIQTTFELKKRKLELPDIKIKRPFKQKIRLKSQQSIDMKNLVLASDQSIGSLLLKQKVKRKNITRSLTEINQKIKQKRKQNRQSLLFFKLNSDQKPYNQNYFQKWKYKSLFQSPVKQEESLDQSFYDQNPGRKFPYSPFYKQEGSLNKQSSFSKELQDFGSIKQLTGIGQQLSLKKSRISKMEIRKRLKTQITTKGLSTFIKNEIENEKIYSKKE